MVAANVKIIEDLKGFLHDVTSYTVNRAFFTQKPTDFSRERDLPMSIVIEMIMDFFKRSLGVEIREFFDAIEHKEVPTQSAFCQQRQKLLPLFFQLWNQVLCASFYRHYADKIKLWRGFRLLAADGSTLYLPPVKELIALFGTQDNQHGQKPMARVLQFYDLLNGITSWGDIFPIRKSESAMLAENIRYLPQDGLLLLDRYFPGFALMYLLMHQGRGLHFVMRCKLGFNSEVKAFVRSHKCSKVVELHPAPNAKSRLKEMGYAISGEETIKVRLVKFKISSKETEVLMTDLLDEQLYTVEDCKALYALRWKIETNYGKQKNQMQLEQFSGLSVLCVQQDYHACLFVSNLHALLEQQCGPYVQSISTKRKYAYKINTNISLAAMKHKVVLLFMTEDIESLLVSLQTAFEKSVVPIRPARQFRRKRKAKRHKGKYQTFTNYKRAV